MEVTHRQSQLILALVSSVVFFAVVGATMLNIALPLIGADFGVTEGTYGWVVSGYALAFGIFNAVHGRLGDVLGMRRLYLAGVLMFGGGSAVVAASPTIEFTIVVRILQGAGAAALPVLGSAMVARVVPVERRGAAMGVILTAVGVAATIGPVLGGGIVQVVGWRWVFGFTALVVLAFPLGWVWLPRELDARASPSFDIVGATLLSVAVAMAMYGFEVMLEVGLGAELAGLLVGSSLLLAAFWYWIGRTPVPFVSRRLLTNRRYVATALVAALVHATRFGTVILVPIFLTNVEELEPVVIGLVMVPGAVAIAVLSTRAGRWADRAGARQPVMAGTAFIVLANLVTAFSTGTSVLGVALGMFIYGIGFAFCQSPMTSAISQLVPREEAGVGMGMFMMIFFVGGAFGTALSVTVVELQPVHAVSWLGVSLGLGARYSNALLALTGLAVFATLLARQIPGDAGRTTSS